MKSFLCLILLLVVGSAFAQTVNVTGRCYYDVNRNQIFDAGDSVMVNKTVYADPGSNRVSAVTNGAGQYSMSLPANSYYFYLIENYDATNYKYHAGTNRTYSAAGSDVVDFAFQPRDSVTSIRTFLQGTSGVVLVPSGNSRTYKLYYDYDGLLPSMPATLTLRFNPLITVTGSSLTPSVSSPGFLQWNFPNLNRNVLLSGPTDSIALAFDFPPTGDTIRSYLLQPQLVPDINVAPTQYNSNYVFREEVRISEPQPIGITKGLKWLRHYRPLIAGLREIAVAVDTTQDGTGYLVAGLRTAPYFGPTDPTLYVARLSVDGLTVWEQNMNLLPGGMLMDNVSAIEHTTDGGCIVLGTVIDPAVTTPFYRNNVMIWRFGASGNVMWTKKMAGSKSHITGKDIVVLADGSFLITGSTTSNDGDFTNSHPDTITENLFVSKLASNGNVLFTKVYGGSAADYGLRLWALQNGTFLVTGVTSSNDGDVIGAHPHALLEVFLTDSIFTEEAWVLNIDASGNMIWNRCYGGSNYSVINGAVENGSGIMLVGNTYSKDGDLPYYPEMCVPLWVLQISPTGNIVWSKLHKLYKGYQDSNYVTVPTYIEFTNAITGVYKTKDGGFVTGGTWGDKYGPIKAKHGLGDMVVVKLNATGDIIWNKAIGGTGLDELYALIPDKKDDIVFAGGTSSGDDDLYLEATEPYSRKQSMVVGKIGIVNAVKGQVFVDYNGNHIKEANEPFYNEGRVQSIKRVDTIVASIFSGQFLNNVDTGNYVSSYRPANNYFTVYPATHNSTFNNFDLQDSVDFALTPVPNINDLEIQIVPLSIPRPGFTVTYRIVTKNVGTALINNVVTSLKYDTRQIYYTASKPPTGNTADSLWWGPFTLNPFEADTVYVSFTLRTPPQLVNGDILTNVATVHPLTGDAAVNNNTVVLREVVRGSYDPNDKTEKHGGVLTTTQYNDGEYLQYLIRFQNTGTDTAFFVTVKDPLQPKLDASTLEVLSTSHPFTFKLEDNIATWDFNRILLPDSTTDEPNSHGFILFRIKPKPGLAMGEQFVNLAGIFFDYNLPVITNQSITVLGNTTTCPNGSIVFTSGMSGNTYQWQVNSGSGYVNLTNGGVYSGVNTSLLRLTGAPTSLRGNKYRCLVNGTMYSPEQVLRFAAQWTGAVSTAWESPSNWSCGSLPDSKTEVIIPVVTNYPQVGSNVSCYSLSLSAGSRVTVKTGFALTITGRRD